MLGTFDGEQRGAALRLLWRLKERQDAESTG
jgi:hypothetical protein